MATRRLQNRPDLSYISSMTTAVVVSIIASLAVTVAWLHMRRQKLSPALRREYEELAVWAERQTAIITDTYELESTEFQPTSYPSFSAPSWLVVSA